MALVGSATGRIVSPIKMKTSQYGKNYGELIIDFGTSSHPDHWYSTAWDEEVIEKCKKLHSGQHVKLTGPVRKWEKPTKGSQVALNIEAVELLENSN